MMTDKDFDNHLRAIMDEGVLPYEEEQWNMLSKRLEDDRVSRNGLLKVLLYKRRDSYTRFVLAVASGVVGFIAYTHLAQNGDKEPKVKQVSSYHTFFSDSHPSSVSAVVPSSTKGVTSIIKDEGSYRNGEVWSCQNDTFDSLIIEPIGASDDFERSRLSQILNNSIAAGDSNRLNDAYDFLNGLEQKEEFKKAIYFDLLGGYNVNSVKNGFNIGVNLRKNIHHKFRVEASIALVGGYNKTYKEQGGIDPTDSNVATGVESYESTINNIFYLQAAPSVSYELYKGFYIGWGLDAQRLINSESEVLIIDSEGGIVGSQPLWDFGTLLSTSYQLSPKVNAGIVYRKSIGSITQGTTSSVSRDYVLMQMSFRIY